MLGEIAVGVLIFFFLVIHYWLTSRGHKIKRAVHFQKGENPTISCPYCGTPFKPSDKSCPNCNTKRKKNV